MHTVMTGVLMNHTHPELRAFSNTTSLSAKREAAAKLDEYLRTHPEPTTATDGTSEDTPVSETTRP